MNTSLTTYLATLNQDAYRIRALVLTGEGRAFCAGADVANLSASLDQDSRPPWHPPHNAGAASSSKQLRDCDVPTIAAVNSYAVGMGFSLALACDMRIAASNAVFQVAQTKRGIMADFGLSYSFAASTGKPASSGIDVHRPAHGCGRGATRGVGPGGGARGVAGGNRR